MKKALFFIVALASVAIGCTKSEVIKAPGRGREIKFDTYLGKTPVTKAESVDLNYLKDTSLASSGFHVSAFLHKFITDSIDVQDTSQIINGSGKILDVSDVPTKSTYMNEDVKWDGLKWKFSKVVYWPESTSGRKLAFAAYALNAQHLMTFADDETSTGKSFTEFTYTVPDAVKDQKDLLVSPFIANESRVAPNNGDNIAPVVFNFKHLLSRVGFQVVANQSSDVEIDIKEITLHGNFPTQGKVSLKDTGVIYPITKEEDANAKYVTQYDFFPNDDHFVTTAYTEPVNIFANRIVSNKTELPHDGDDTSNTDTTVTESYDDSNRFMMIMPSQQDATGATQDNDIDPGAYIDVVYELTGGEEQKARVSLDGFKFEAGKSYTFIFKVSTLSISFDVSVEDWTPYFGSSEDKTGTNGIYTLMPM